MGDRLLDYDGSWLRGVKSDSDPGQIPVGYAWNAINMINVGGQLSCRPGLKCLIKFPQGKLQGLTLFTPNIGPDQLVAAISGVIYVSTFPFKTFSILPNVQFSPFAKQIFWVNAVQSVQRRTNDFASAIDVINPKSVLFMQDGGSTAPAWYDGSQSGHIRDRSFETPAGKSMVWVGDRLWVANGRNVFASDIDNPFSFREQVYLGSVAAFNFSKEVTAMARTPSLEFPQLLVFTLEAASIIEANIRDRAAWPTTDNFQREVFQVGCVSQRSIVHHQGSVSWFSPSGVTFFDAAIAGKLTQRLPIRDNEMMVSKTKLFEDLSTVAGAAFGQFLLFSVPADDLFNKHTWCLNNASIETLTDDSGPSWCGFWLGTRPVEWVYGVIAGAERIYHVSADADGENRLWEAFRPERLDNGCPIMWAVETRAYFGQTWPNRRTPPAFPVKFMFADVGLVGIEENLDLGIFYAGGVRGAYKPILAKKISVARGSLSFDQTITAISRLFAFKAQSRVARTEDANQQTQADDTGSCPPESQRVENVDDSFQLLVVGHGPAGIRFIRTFGMTTAEDLNGEPLACVDETKLNAIRFDGVGVQSTDLQTAEQDLSSRAVAQFFSNKVAVVEQDGITAVGLGSSQSIVSQEAADRVAEIIATKLAEAELAGFVSPVFSIGEGF